MNDLAREVIRAPNGQNEQILEIGRLVLLRGSNFAVTMATSPWLQFQAMVMSTTLSWFSSDFSVGIRYYLCLCPKPVGYIISDTCQMEPKTAATDQFDFSPKFRLNMAFLSKHEIMSEWKNGQIKSYFLLKSPKFCV